MGLCGARTRFLSADAMQCRPAGVGAEARLSGREGYKHSRGLRGLCREALTQGKRGLVYSPVLRFNLDPLFQNADLL